MKLSFKFSNILQWGIILYIFLLPWQARYIFAEYSTAFPFYGDLSLYITDGLFLVLMFLWLFKISRRGVRSYIFTDHRKGTLLFVILCFFLFAGLSMFWSPDVMVGFFKWLRLGQMIVLGTMIFTLKIRPRAVFVAFVGAGTIQGIIALQQFLDQVIPASTWLGMSAQNAENLGVSVIESSDTRWLRAYGTLPHPNILGGFMVIAGLSVTAWYISASQSYYKIRDKVKEVGIKTIRGVQIQMLAGLASFIFIIVGLLLSFSRTSWLGFAVGWLVIFSALLKQADKINRGYILQAGIRMVLTGIALFAMLNIIVGPLWTQRISDQNRLAVQSVSERTMLLEQSKDIISGAGILGVGIGGYLPAVMMSRPGAVIYQYQPVHNIWLLLWAELGLIGLSLFFLWMLYVCKFYYQLIKTANVRTSLEEITIVAVLLSVGIMACFEHFWWTLPVGFISIGIWLCLSFQIMRS